LPEPVRRLPSSFRVVFFSCRTPPCPIRPPPLKPPFLCWRRCFLTLPFSIVLKFPVFGLTRPFPVSVPDGFQGAAFLHSLSKLLFAAAVGFFSSVFVFSVQRFWRSQGRGAFLCSSLFRTFLLGSDEPRENLALPLPRSLVPFQLSSITCGDFPLIVCGLPLLSSVHRWSVVIILGIFSGGLPPRSILFPWRSGPHFFFYLCSKPPNFGLRHEFRADLRPLPPRKSPGGTFPPGRSRTAPDASGSMFFFFSPCVISFLH